MGLIEFLSYFFPHNVHYICNNNLLFVVLLSTEIENVTSFAGLKGSFYRHIDQEKEEKQIHNLEPSLALRGGGSGSESSLEIPLPFRNRPELGHTQS